MSSPYVTNVEKQTNRQTVKQTDSQFWESTLTVAEKGIQFQNYANDINMLYEIISTWQPFTHPSSSGGA